MCTLSSWIRILHCTLGIWLVAATVAYGAPPPNFQNEQLIDLQGLPMSLAFLPDGRMLIVQKSGVVRLADPQTLPVTTSVLLELPDVDAEGERGLLDIALDPAFESNGWLYVVYSSASEMRVRISRFTYAGGVIDPASEWVVWEDSETFSSCCHYGGGLDFGPDGMLYLTRGDEFFLPDPTQVSTASQDLSTARGKVLRIASDGTIPGDNPFVGVPGALPEIWALGLRNPFRARWDVPTGRFFIGDVGGNVQSIAFEEINLGVAGANYGWPSCEGPAGNPDFPNCNAAVVTDPLFAYPHNGFGGAVTAGFVYRGEGFPEAYQEAFFYGDYTHQYIRYLTFDEFGAVTGVHDFDPVVGLVIFLTQGPEGALYYTDVNGGVHRIVYRDQAPSQAQVQVDVTGGPAPLEVGFTASAVDPEGQDLTLRWIFGDGAEAITSGVPSGTPASVSHTYTVNGLYEIRVEATDGEGQSSLSAPLILEVGLPPQASIDTPVDGAMFRSGDLISFSATALDPDGSLGPDDYRWTVVFRHNDHFHPAYGPLTGTLGSFTIPSTQHDFHDDTAYEIRLTVTDADGLSVDRTVEILPEKVNLLLDTVPAGLTLGLDGVPLTTPHTYDTLIGFRHLVQAATQCVGGVLYEPTGWSDGGAASHEITVPAADFPLVATFVAVDTCVEDPPEDPPPVTVEDAAVVPRGGCVTLDVLANDFDPEWEPLATASLGMVEAPHHGALSPIDPATGLVPYCHDGSTSEADHFTYTVATARGVTSEPTTVHLRVVGPEFPYLEGLAFLVEADFGITADAAGTVERWLDLSGGGHHLSSAGTPTVGSGGPAGRAFVRFGGSNDHLERSGGLPGFPEGDGDRTLFLVVSYRSDSFAGFTYGSTDEGLGCQDYGNRAFGLVTDGSGRLTVQGWCAEADFHSTTGGEDAGWMVQSAVVDDQQLLHYKDGQLIDSLLHTFATDASTGSLVLGAELDGHPHGDLDIAAVLLFDRALEPVERLAVETYLQEKYLTTAPVDQAPVARDDFFVVPAGGTVVLDLLANDSDDIGLDPGQVMVSGPWQNAVDPATGAVTYTHGGGPAPASDTFTYTVRDVTGQLSGVATVTVQILDPALLTDALVLHLESDLGMELDGGLVSFWPDFSGRGNHLTATGGLGLVSGVLNGQDYVRLEGFGDRLERLTGLNGLPGGTTDRTMLAVVRYHDTGFGGITYGSPGAPCSTAGNQVFGLGVDPSGDLLVQAWCTDFHTSIPGTGAGWMVQSAVVDDQVLYHYRNQELIDTRAHTFATDASGRLVIGAELDGSPHVAMDVAAVLVYDRALSEAERQGVESYLASKYFGDLPPAPVPTTHHRTAPEGGTLAVELLEGDPSLYQFILMEAPSHGTVTLSGSVATYSHGGGSPAWDGFVYTVTDPLGQSAEITVQLTLLPTLAGLVLHLDAVNGVYTSGDDVISWLDLSIAGNHLVATASPKSGAADLPAGVEVVVFDGAVDQLLRLEAPVGLPEGNADRTAFLVTRYRDTGFGGFAYGSTSCGGVFGLVVDHQGKLTVQGWCSDYRSAAVANGAGWLIQSVRLDGGWLEHFRDGQLIDTAAVTLATDGAGVIVLGTELDGRPAVAMDVAAVLVFDRALGEGERLAVESALEARYLRP